MWYTVCPQNRLEAFAMNIIKCFLEVDEAHVPGKGTFHSIHCSMMFRKAKICSMQPRPFRNPACSYLSLASEAQSILLRRTLQKTLLGMDRSVMPRQMSQLLRSPFSSLWGWFRFQILAKRSVNTKEAVVTSALSYSACSEWIPGA